jgi:hypothetical protein
MDSVSVEQTIANIRARNVQLSVEDDNKIAASRPLLPDERKVFEENRSEACALIRATPSETPTQSYERGLKDGYAAGVRGTLEEMKAQPIAIPASGPPPTATTPDGEIEKFIRWQAQRSDYWKWEPETIQVLREALVEGDRVQPMFAYSCLIVSADGREREFKRVPTKRK